MSAMQIWLSITIEGNDVKTQADVTTVPRSHLGEAPGGVSPDVLRHGLRICEQVADFADRVRTV